MRNAVGDVIQFVYGEDGMDGTSIEVRLSNLVASDSQVLSMSASGILALDKFEPFRLSCKVEHQQTTLSMHWWKPALMPAGVNLVYRLVLLQSQKLDALRLSEQELRQKFHIDLSNASFTPNWLKAETVEQLRASVECYHLLEGEFQVCSIDLTHHESLAVGISTRLALLMLASCQNRERVAHPLLRLLLPGHSLSCGSLAWCPAVCLTLLLKLRTRDTPWVHSQKWIVSAVEATA